LPIAWLLSVVLLWENSIPSPRLFEMTLRWPVPVPPMTL